MRAWGWLLVMLATLASLPLARGTKKEPAKPKVYLHIGPCKTGTTYIQTYFAKMKQILPKYKLCWPGPPSAGAFHHFAEAIENGHNVSTLLRDIDACLERGLNAFVSSEKFSVAMHLTNVKRVLGKYDVHVVAFHRELFHAWYSGYTQGHKNTLDSAPFSSTLLWFLDQFDHHQSYVSRNAQLRQLRAQFGADRLTIVDYDGALAAGKDIAELIITDIVGAPGFEPPPFQVPKTNVHPSMLAYNLIHLVRRTVQLMGCSFCAHDRAFVLDLFGRYGKWAAANAAKLPVATSALVNFRYFSEQESLAFRAEFAPQLLFGNHSAAMAARDRFAAREVRTRDFFGMPACVAWLAAEVRRLHEDGRLCTCAPDALFP